jgi:hypothetical protein
MLPFEDRFTRQRKLAEVGQRGQARLAAGSSVVAAGDGAMVEVTFLHRAGVGRVEVSRLLAQRPFAHAEHFEFAASRSLAGAAWRALGEIREHLELEAH